MFEPKPLHTSAYLAESIRAGAARALASARPAAGRHAASPRVAF